MLLLSALVILLAITAQARFAVTDLRLPQDANHAHQTLAQIHHCLGSAHDWPLALWAAVGETAGWYNLIIAAGMHLTGGGAGVMRALHLVWIAGALLGLWMVARRLWGEAAGLLALLLVSPLAMGIHQLGRMGWIHVAELALLLQVLDGMLADPGLSRRRSVLRVGLGGVLALALRPTGLVWVATVAPLLLLARRQGAAWSRVLAVAGTWALALLPLIRDMGPYLEDKLEARPRYGAIVGLDLMLPQLLDDLGLPWALLSLAGVVLLIAGRKFKPAAPLLVLVSWVLLPVALYLLFNVGLVNFPVLYAAAALLGAAGLARLPALPVVVPALVLWLGAYSAQWLPMPTAEDIYRRIDDANIALHRDSPNNYYRPYKGLSPDMVNGLLDGTCPRDRSKCAVVVESSLYHPAGLDAGRLGLFVSGRRQVELLEMRDLGAPEEARRARAYARFDCPEHTGAFTQRHPAVARRGPGVRAALGMKLGKRVELEEGCSFLFYTPAD